MTTGDQPRRRENAFTLIRRLVSGTVQLAKLEVQRGRQEITENVVSYRTGVVLLAIALGARDPHVIVLMIVLRLRHRRARPAIRPWLGRAPSSLLILLLALAGLLRVARHAQGPSGEVHARTRPSKRSRRTSSGRNAC